MLYVKTKYYIQDMQEEQAISTTTTDTKLDTKIDAGLDVAALEQEHQMNLHDSKKSPVAGCPTCKYETYRRSHRCHGDGWSSAPVPVKES